MKILSKRLLAICSVIFLSTIAQSVLAGPVYTHRSTIFTLDSGWAADSYSVRLVTDTNPAGCAAPQAGYVTSPSDPGRRLYQDQLREAFLSKLSVTLLISDTVCTFGKPTIISVGYCRPDVNHGLTCP